MKIAFTGSSSTGKTTLATALCDIGCVKYFINIDSRKIIEKHNTKNIDDFTSENYLAFQREWVDTKKKSEEHFNDYITDRSYIDAIAYMKCKNMVDQTLIGVALQEMKKYDFVFYLPFGKIAFEDDGYRSRNNSFNAMVDEKILELLDYYSIEHYKVEASSLEQRIQYIQKIIKCNSNNE